MPTLLDLVPYFESLVGSNANVLDKDSSTISIFDNNELGHSQFNEILLLLGFKRISYEFFQFLVDGSFEYQINATIKSVNQLKQGIDRFTVIALLFYGNIKYAFRELAIDSDKLYDKIVDSLPTDSEIFENRHKPIRQIVQIPPEKTYLLGYLIESEIIRRIKDNPEDNEAKGLQRERQQYIEIGESNQIVYLSSDHLDVYVATSMRLKHEFLYVNKVVNQIFNHKSLKKLNLRYFDPTQAYCKNRIDKGLSEALMLKTALCTIYLAQESETFGKDSELASTLAQGKAVIAFVPHGDKIFVDELISDLMRINSEKTEKEIIIDQLRVYKSDLAWLDPKVREWIANINKAPILEMKQQLYNLAEDYYNKRAETLKKNHPLGIQVNLNSGVANGVLVVRKIKDCIDLVKNIILNEMKYSIEKEPQGMNENCYLKEEISQCIFRLKTGNPLLTNTFWNFYTQDKNL